ncbi:peptidylprolyl isomerase [Nocardioides sp.]|uniref:peptidylprolyl isomerase n=1 Tax=Nocardioides sp. TaxID=35761 RepID=UPI002ED39768
MSTRLLALLAVPVLAIALLGCGSDTPQAADDSGAEPDAETVTCTYRETGTAPAREVDAPGGEAVAEGEVSVTLGTGVGDLALTLDAEQAPCTVHSFVSLAEQGWLDGTTCHRLTTSGIFVLQCGDPSGTGSGGPGYAFDDELSGDETYPAGTLAMANSGTNTNGSQFFIVYQDTQLPPLYTVFGTVDDASLETVREVADAGTDHAFGRGDGAPLTEVEIEAATVSRG